MQNNRLKVLVEPPDAIYITKCRNRLKSFIIRSITQRLKTEVGMRVNLKDTNRNLLIKGFDEYTITEINASGVVGKFEKEVRQFGWSYIDTDLMVDLAEILLEE